MIKFRGRMIRVYWTSVLDKRHRIPWLAWRCQLFKNSALSWCKFSLNSTHIKKLKLSHYTPLRRLGGEEVYLLLIHDLGTSWGRLFSVTPRPRFTSGERTLGTHCTGSWVGPRAGLDREVTGKILCLCRGSNLRSPGRPARSQTLTELPGSPF
jgi:hypothetical protein